MSNFYKFAIATILVTLVSSNTFAAGQCNAKSGNETAAVLELYTSEGCNSCPPADKWVSSLAPDGFKSNQIVPLAFHVDYWDYIGWTDRFAQSEFSGRHRGLARANGSGTVYTPQIFVSGKDIRLAFSNSQTERYTEADQYHQAPRRYWLGARRIESKRAKFKRFRQPRRPIR